MKSKALLLLVGAFALGALVMGCFQVMGPALNEQRAPALAMGQPGPPGGGSGGGGGHGGGGGEEGTETAVNNLSFPVIWADEPMAIGTPNTGVSTLNGEWVYCDEPDSDGNPVVYDPKTEPVDPSWKMAFLQQDAGNVWKADAKSWEEVSGSAVSPLVVDLIDWGDNLESQDWLTTSKIRTEVVLFKNLSGNTTMIGYEMLHVVGRGVDEMHGLSVLQKTDETDTTTDAQRAEVSGITRPIVYTNHARLTIQRLNIDRDDPSAALLKWNPVDGNPAWISVDADGNDLGLVEAPLFNETVYDGTTGPGGYSAEINIKGRIVYGYTWNPADDGAEEGDYRLTFSLDDNSGADFDDSTAILDSAEEVVEALASGEEPQVGGHPKVVADDRLTYIDIRLSAQGGGGSGAGGGKGSGGGGKGSGGGGRGGGGHAGGDDA